MRRRGFLGSIVGAAVAGPSMAKQAIASGIEGLSLGSGMGDVGFAGQAVYEGFGPSEAKQDPNYDPTHWPKQELANFLGKSAADLHRERLETHVGQIDPDLACMRSISLQAKIRMQRDRTFERNRAQQRGWLERQLQDAMKRLSA